MLIHSYVQVPRTDVVTLEDDALVTIVSDGRCDVSEPGVIHSGLEVIGESCGLADQWQMSGYRVQRGRNGDCHWSRAGDVVCVAISLNADQCTHIAQSTEQTYYQLLKTAYDMGYHHPLRFWNYLPAINQGNGDSELYKQFCLGRNQAFERHKLPASDYPSASALGHHSQGAVIFGFLGRRAGQHIENPAQVSAYHYPREYGPKSPSFARATSIDFPGADARLFISGTASVLGCNTVAVGDIKTQLSVTVDNLDKLLAKAEGFVLHSLKVYVREMSHLQQVSEHLDRQYPKALKLYTHSDVCRANLLVEIEAVGYGTQ